MGYDVETLEEGQTSYTAQIKPNAGGEDINNALEGSGSMVGLKGRDKIIIKPDQIYPPRVLLLEARVEVKYVRRVTVEVYVEGQAEPEKFKVLEATVNILLIFYFSRYDS